MMFASPLTRSFGDLIVGESYGAAPTKDAACAPGPQDAGSPSKGRADAELDPGELLRVLLELCDSDARWILRRWLNERPHLVSLDSGARSRTSGPGMSNETFVPGEEKPGDGCLDGGSEVIYAAEEDPVSNSPQKSAPEQPSHVVASSSGAPHRSVGSKFEGIISQDVGEFTLTADNGEQSQGSYRFHWATGLIVDEMSNEMGTFSCDPIGVPFPNVQPNPYVNTPCITITDSEIMAEIQKQENEGAYFVLPSQLNGAEYPSHQVVVRQMEDYKYDNTGGPRGQLAVHPAVGQFVLDNAACVERERGINAIDGLLDVARRAGTPMELVNGYLKLPEIEQLEEASAMLDLVWRHLHLLRPLVMAGVPANGLHPRKSRFSKETHRVNLVYASAVPLEAYLNRCSSPAARTFQGRVAEMVLVAQYYGALKTAARAARERGSIRIFLMPLGGGVFNNPWQSIARSMALAVEMLGEGDLAKLDIRALTWCGNPDEHKLLRDLLGRFNKLRRVS